jgi:uncharacterized membrane protein YtjA (UPF0391 family)
MKTKTQTIKLVNGGRSFANLSISSQTAAGIATIVCTVALVAAVLSLPAAIFLLTYGF